MTSVYKVTVEKNNEIQWSTCYSSAAKAINKVMLLDTETAHQLVDAASGNIDTIRMDFKTILENLREDGMTFIHDEDADYNHHRYCVEIITIY